MGTTPRRIIVSAMVVGAAVGVAALIGIGSVVGIGPVAGASQASRSLTMDLYMRGTDQWADLSTPPSPGDRNLLGSDLYLLGGSDSQPAPAGDRIGRRIAACTVATSGAAVCDGIIDLTDRGTIAAQLEVLIPGGNQGIAITGGTGEFAGASGVIVETNVPGNPNDRVLRLSLSGLSNP